ncbi:MULTISPECIES: SseB family protein [unclassified Clostridium]|uniref:SseB family protein n=1 Tax=unclassified Clostridium TaxID=2614128 RepID=UPI0025BD5CFB|nr:SseB family protein [Clostridium sp.]MDY4252297.1 SseB family protein [Clostridium sp.]
MGLINNLFGRKQEEQKVKKNDDIPTNFVLGVHDTFKLKESNDLIVVGPLKGTTRVGDAVYISNLDSDTEPTSLSTIISIEKVPNNLTNEASDCQVALRIEGGSLLGIRKGTVLYTRTTSVKTVHDAYINAMGDCFVAQMELDIPDSELEQFSIADCYEVWRLFSWFQSKTVKGTNEGQNQINYKKIERVAKQLIKKIFEADEIYCVFNKRTGEPNLFSTTKKIEEGYMCMPPDILIFPKSYKSMAEAYFSKYPYEIKEIKNGESKDGIYNFLGETFYLNGACGVKVISNDVSIASGMLVPEPNYGDLPEINIPITNPDLERWLLLMGQLGNVDDENSKLIYGLYYKFMSKELLKARLLVPIQKDGEIPPPNENGATVLDKDVKLKFPIDNGKDDRQAIRMYTDWKRLRMVYDENWSGLIEPVKDFIDVFDVLLNMTEYYEAGIYISKDSYYQMEAENKK